MSNESPPNSHQTVENHAQIDDNSPESHKVLDEKTQQTANNLAIETEQTAKVLETRNAKRAKTLADATLVLTKQVDVLTNVVKINNEQISSLRKEVNQKPDDVEVQLISGMAKVTTRKARNKVIGTALLAIVCSSGVAYKVSEYESTKRCEVNAKNINTIVNLLESLPNARERFGSTIDDLNSNRNDC